MIKQNWNIETEEVKRILMMHENATKNLYLINEQQKVKVGEKTTTTGKEISLEIVFLIHRITPLSRTLEE